MPFLLCTLALATRLVPDMFLSWPTLFFPNSGLRPYDWVFQRLFYIAIVCYVVSFLDTNICSSPNVAVPRYREDLQLLPGNGVV